ncbi:MAG TPA: NAD(P)-dependent oxidoreductase [Actinomycetota bacterium]|nr:NAD(P)-dependent oxidoreductase [Actinomycetota bacterium]
MDGESRAGVRVGFVGLGTMGSRMARRLLDHGFSLSVHNRTRDREEPLTSGGARRAETPAGAASGAGVVVVMVSDTPDVEEVLFGPHGVAEGATAGAVVVDMSTISPAATREFGRRLSGLGVGLVDAPVSGGSEGAERGTLAVMAGGSPQDVEKARPVLEAMASTVTHVGPLGSGQLTKAVNQVIVGGTYLAVAEGILLGLRAGLDMEAVIEAISHGACRSWVLENRSANMLRDDYPLGFRLALHRKDLRIALEEAAAAGVEMPLSSLLAAVEDAAMTAGDGDADVSVVARELRRRSLGTTP